MDLKKYPKYTIIVRGYTPKQTESILEAMKGYEKEFAIEVTMNTDSALEMIQTLNENYGEQIMIGAGTVMNIDEERAAISSGAKFLLGPQSFTKEMITFAHEKGVLTVPAAFTPSEVTSLFRKGADIVKVFPASSVGPSYFKAIQAPLGHLPLMAVGGVSVNNITEYLNNDCQYFGLGSGMFHKKDVVSQNVAGLRRSITELLALDTVVS
ncbi:bifunctional 4-hydroxy-2-oxoglutarate aldolase/2-dehydro-3-deoxy-phosphogluconate aldolase [Lactiplantibacillus pentosus]|jgi:2-dehydro-3-deoxyphosphogluconate aldolase/(4S)-4-hydroxy-2-oxoglutarate aldolase|uniref:2-dehydro-3-deoxyphosphogluconate aldolase n=1 Tax=Lactiplantibacillus pentosus TaxID=1589 RepID=A0AB37RIZ2_LACPE|nr:bifunctional 4-hydroxy-2-oxoglutarate aldolase/2-dehydro-3-deoxy-phosphogluconate aldolase [Lactiplantibacillus pentosus]ASG80170.1 2-dehydro-3-deoxyphosphogluconate aldolase [Lactiplantibacillus pentosus]MCB5222735.1 bifunctional 4-hydroxy-2-oxoglutarate aldolase/2-dehydro-3-deoxy-phosphogluconate aldolase [Lactiplantibacillus pentosus]MCT3289012.1 2-dehydro-3-deoxyphosphogluconate aldolase [Lactiplantibacillus pentosus]MDO7805869.1 bifunctional 4-hydroxy-2-oxoglutarate aldolase/2-dehydro-3